MNMEIDLIAHLSRAGLYRWARAHGSGGLLMRASVRAGALVEEADAATPMKFRSYIFTCVENEEGCPLYRYARESTGNEHGCSQQQQQCSNDH